MSITDIKTPDLSTETKTSDTSISVRLTGSAETDAMKSVDTFLKSIHGAALEGKIPEVVVDLRALEFMNSSCFKAFVTWIGILQEAPQAQQYRVRFLSDSKKHWQSRSLSALACFAVDLISVEPS